MVPGQLGGGLGQALSRPWRRRAQVSGLQNLAPSVKRFEHALRVYVYLFVCKLYIFTAVMI